MQLLHLLLIHNKMYTSYYTNKWTNIQNKNNVSWLMIVHANKVLTIVICVSFLICIFFLRFRILPIFYSTRILSYSHLIGANSIPFLFLCSCFLTTIEYQHSFDSTPFINHAHHHSSLILFFTHVFICICVVTYHSKFYHPKD